MRTERGGSISTEMTKRPARRCSSRPVGGGASGVARGRRRGDGRDARGPAGSWVRARRRDGAADRRQRVERGPHRRDVLRASSRSSRRRSRRPAATNRGVMSARYAGSRGVDELALDPLGEAGVREDRVAVAAHRGEGVEAALRPGAAVDPDDVDVERLRGRSAAAPGVVPSGSSSSSPNVSIATIGRSAAALASSTAIRELVDRRERLEPEQVDAALEEPVDGLAEGRPDGRARRGGGVRGSGAPSGPIEPATRTSRPATSRASRAICAPRRASLPGLVGRARTAPAGPGSRRTSRSR